MLKEQKGITLVALIITIIVMLILAGVSISLVVGENGVLTQAQSAGTESTKGALKEAVALASGDLMARYYANSAGYAEDYDEEAEILAVINANYSEGNAAFTNFDATGATKSVLKSGDVTINVEVKKTTKGYHTLKVVD